jgi:hypothetical protein
MEARCAKLLHEMASLAPKRARGRGDEGVRDQSATSVFAVAVTLPPSQWRWWLILVEECLDVLIGWVDAGPSSGNVEQVTRQENDDEAKVAG